MEYNHITNATTRPKQDITSNEKKMLSWTDHSNIADLSKIKQIARTAGKSCTYCIYYIYFFSHDY